LLDSSFLTAVTMRSAILWDVKICSLVEVHRHFGRIDLFHVQGRIVSQAINQQLLAECFLLASCLPYSSTL
jgi:hypothetical protein